MMFIPVSRSLNQNCAGSILQWNIIFHWSFSFIEHDQIGIATNIEIAKNMTELLCRDVNANHEKRKYKDLFILQTAYFIVRNS